jgi:hypothetical protein
MKPLDSKVSGSDTAAIKKRVLAALKGPVSAEKAVELQRLVTWNRIDLSERAKTKLQRAVVSAAPAREWQPVSPNRTGVTARQFTIANAAKRAAVEKALSNPLFDEVARALGSGSLIALRDIGEPMVSAAVAAMKRIMKLPRDEPLRMACAGRVKLLEGLIFSDLPLSLRAGQCLGDLEAARAICKGQTFPEFVAAVGQDWRNSAYTALDEWPDSSEWLSALVRRFYEAVRLYSDLPGLPKSHVDYIDRLMGRAVHVVASNADYERTMLEFLLDTVLDPETSFGD